MSEFDVEKFLIGEMKDLNKKLDDWNTNNHESHIKIGESINGLRRCIHNKIDEVKTTMNTKFEDHTKLHLAQSKSYISTRIFIFAMIVVMGCMGFVFTTSITNSKDITELKTTHDVKQKVQNENRLSIEDTTKRPGN